ncbi:MAG: glycoside hydrolase family 9 protein [Planctomycetes bacterium]|nr:glycoside hydrolase family 9 protein [Planctomycetota bacterium]
MVAIFILLPMFHLASEAPRAPNGSFEEGAAAPAGWRLDEELPAAARGERLEGRAYRGRRSLGGESAAPARIWRSDRIAIPARGDFILSGWLSVASGEAWIAAVFIDGQGRALERFEAPRARAGDRWTYAAVETLRLHAEAHFAEIEFWVAGQAALDEVLFLPRSPLVVANGGFEAALDQKGRIPLWSEEKDGALLPGERAGGFKLDPGAAREGARGLSIACRGSWFAVSSVSYGVPAWSDRFEIAVRARCSLKARAQVLAVWTGDAPEQVFRVDRGPVVEGAEWQVASTGPLEAPAGAKLVRPVLAALAGEGSQGEGAADFDEVDFITLPPRQKRARVLVNQVGYGRHGPKSAIILTNFFPQRACTGRFGIVTFSGEARQEKELACSGRMLGEKSADWGWYFWRAEFSDFDEEGSFKIRAAVEGVEGTSFPFAVQRDLLFRETAPLAAEFFFVQRCGFAVPGWHGACHLDDAKLPDGSHRDLSGGWHSAGDYNKITWEYGDGGAMYALAKAADGAPEFFSRFDRDGDQLPDIVDEARWGARYMGKLAIPSAGKFLKDVQQGPDRQGWMRWVSPEKQTDNLPGTADDPVVLEGEGHSPLALGGWARTAGLLKARGLENDFLERAVEFWNERSKRTGLEGEPLYLVSAVDLYLATRAERFLAFARKSAEALLSTGDPNGPLPGGYSGSGDLPAAALAYFALELPAEPLGERARGRLRRQLEAFLAAADNPLGIPRHGQGESAYFFESSSAYGWNFISGARAWAGLLIYRAIEDRRAWAYAADQLDFLLGKNPFALCMFEGKGSFNPPRYHHRYDSIPGRERGAVPGAIPNGFVRDIGSHDRPGFDLSTGGRPHPSYRTSEPWLVHNVFYLLAIGELHEVER